MQRIWSVLKKCEPVHDPAVRFQVHTPRLDPDQVSWTIDVTSLSSSKVSGIYT